MLSTKTTADVRAVWAGYGKALVKAFGFPRDSIIHYEDLERLRPTMTPASAKEFIDFIKRQIAELASMRFLADSE